MSINNEHSPASTNVNVRAKIILNFYGGLIVSIIVIFVLVYLAMMQSKAFSITLIAIGAIAGIFVLLTIRKYWIHLRHQRHKAHIAHADDQTIVVMQKPHVQVGAGIGGLLLSALIRFILPREPVVHHKLNEKHNYNHRITEPKTIDADDTRVVEEVPLLEAPKPRLPEFVRYEEVKGRIPAGHAIVGIGENSIVTRESEEARPCVWIPGGTGTGKTNSVKLRIHEDYMSGRNFLGADPHWTKEDSLYRALDDTVYLQRFLRPLAKTDEEILEVFRYFKQEFKRRKATPYSWDRTRDRITLLVDEVGSLVTDIDKGNPTEVEISSLLKEIVRICGQESRGFDMWGIFISQDAAGLAWLRKRASVVIGHQVLMMSERELVCNERTDIARSMDEWPRGRTVVYGLAMRGVQVVQQPVLERLPMAPATSVVDEVLMPAPPLREQVAVHRHPTQRLTLVQTDELQTMAPTINDALEAWKRGATSVRALEKALDVTHYKAYDFYQELKLRKLV